MENKEIIPFIYDEHPVRVVLDDLSAPWFVAKDVCRVLGISDYRQAIKILDEDERGGYKVPTHQRGLQEATCINEPGLYALIFRSNKPNAKTFRRWVTHEVLPSLRRTGQYAINENIFIENRTTMKELTKLVSSVVKVMERLDLRLDFLMGQEQKLEQIEERIRKSPLSSNNNSAFVKIQQEQLGQVRPDVRQFLIERTIVHPEAGTLLSWMHIMYEQWCYAHCLIPIGRNQFYDECRTALAGYGEIKTTRENRKLYISGIRLRDDKDL